MHMPWVQLVRVEIGNLIKRFSQDMSLVDMQLPVAFGVTLQTFLTCIAKGVMIAIGSGYMSARTSRQIRLLDLEAKAPLYDHFLQTIDGGATNRAFQWQERFTKMNEELLGLSQKSFYALYSAQQWLQVVLDLLVAALATLLTALVLFATSKSTSGSLVNITCDTVSIDGRDITAISKDKLRAAIVTAPQQLLLIAGTARENFLLQILDRIHEHGGLDASIGSVPLMESQRCPLCIGRALLQPGGIVILDEPTSGFD
ncbi:hypothetical protein MY4824_005473 [Beauveria thailandica]